MSEPIKPALSSEEWALALSKNAQITEDGFISVTDDDAVWSPAMANPRHSIAALTLYGQPFGFTHEDVQNLRAGGEWFRMDGLTAAEFRKSLADRIAALLPPEKK